MHKLLVAHRGEITVLVIALSCIAPSGVPPTLYAQDEPMTAREFAQSLAQNGIPAGLVIAQDEWFAHRTANSVRPQLRSSQALRDSLSRFNAGNARYRAAERAGFVTIRGLAEPITVRQMLSRAANVDELSSASAWDAVSTRVVWLMSGKKPEGIIGTGTFPGPECPLNARVRLSAGSTTAVNVLTEVVQQAPGLAWVARS